MDRLKQANRSTGLAAAEPSFVFVIKVLLYPLITVVSLVICLAICHEPLYGQYFLLAVLGFLGTADFLDIAQVARASGANGLHRLFRLRPLFEIVLRWLLVVAFIWGLLHLSKLSQRFDPQVLALWAGITPVLLWLGKAVTEYGLWVGGLHQAHPRKAVVVGLTDLGLRLEEELTSDSLLRTTVMGFFEDRTADRLPAAGLPRVLGKPAELPEFIRRNDVNVVYVTLPMTRHPRIIDLLDSLRDSTVSVYFVPDLFVFNLIQARFDFVNNIPVMAICESPFYGFHSIVKRLSDIVISGAIIALIAPVLIAVAIGIRMTSRGSIIFKQRRYGLDGKEIVVYKFRSMNVTEDGDKEYHQVSRNDTRVTGFGNFLRKTSLDELPQFFNVLEGSMSIVGPRPHAIAVNEQYRRLIPSYMVRHKVKPGITGWAQVNGYRGGDDLESMKKRIDCDLEYLRHWSLRLDLVIMLKTFSLVLSDRRAY